MTPSVRCRASASTATTAMSSAPTKNGSVPYANGIHTNGTSKPSTKQSAGAKRDSTVISYVRLILPSTLTKQLIPPLLYRLACYGCLFFWFVIGVLILRKTLSATTAVRYIKTHGHTVSLESIESSDAFAQLVTTLDKQFTRPPAFFLLNQYALNMTFNFLCNTQVHPGAHDRFIFVTLDSTARDVLAKQWPQIRQFYWDTPSLHVSYMFYIVHDPLSLLRNTGTKVIFRNRSASPRALIRPSICCERTSRSRC